MSAERVARHDEDHQTLVIDVETDVECQWPIVISGRHIEFELSERNAEWLAAVGLPTAIDRVRRRAPA